MSHRIERDRAQHAWDTMAARLATWRQWLRVLGVLHVLCTLIVIVFAVRLVLRG